MTKFRKWLIHKLGGVVKENAPVLLNNEKFTLETITAKVKEEDYLIYKDDFGIIVMNDLKLKLLDHIQPTYIHKFDSETHTYYFEAKIKLPSAYIKREANND